ncbi:unnamed protein product [Caenorhabditis nigoni]
MDAEAFLGDVREGKRLPDWCLRHSHPASTEFDLVKPPWSFNETPMLYKTYFFLVTFSNLLLLFTYLIDTTIRLEGPQCL